MPHGEFAKTASRRQLGFGKEPRCDLDRRHSFYVRTFSEQPASYGCCQGAMLIVRKDACGGQADESRGCVPPFWSASGDGFIGGWAVLPFWRSRVPEEDSSKSRHSFQKYGAHPTAPSRPAAIAAWPTSSKEETSSCSSRCRMTTTPGSSSVDSPGILPFRRAGRNWALPGINTFRYTALRCSHLTAHWKSRCNTGDPTRSMKDGEVSSEYATSAGEGFSHGIRYEPDKGW